VYCQNWDISQNPEGGIKVSPEVVSKMISHQVSSARNTNWVGGDPTSNLAYILEVLSFCDAPIPQVWNSNMYLSVEAMKLLDGVIDVYLTDFKYGNDACAQRLSNVQNYFKIVKRNHKLANKQCELIIRHLVLPNHVECCTKVILKWIAENLDITKVRVNVMDQYHPDWKAWEYKDINRRLKISEFAEAINYGKELGLNLVR
jgi:putative pyruvate formate lyase activating enzyme